jgi:methionyl-tRNA formyltransferase
MLNVVAARTPWSRRIFFEDIETLSGEWIVVETGEELSAVVGGNSQIERIYFLHWSEKVPTEITERFECINFHMTDLPFGRGGSPLQNLISLGHEETVLCALRMTNDFDAGPIYVKRRLPLHGSAEAIYARAGRLAAQMIEEIHSAPHEPVPQEGAVHYFRSATTGTERVPSDLGLSSYL